MDKATLQLVIDSVFRALIQAEKGHLAIQLATEVVQKSLDANIDLVIGAVQSVLGSNSPTT